MVKNMTGLMVASWYGNIKIVKDLIKVGADVNARLADGRTALILAIEQGQSQCAALLIKAGADVNITADINLSHSNCVKSIQEGSDRNQMTSNQLRLNNDATDDLPAKNGDEASENDGKKAAVSTPTPRIVIKQEVQEIPVDDSDDGDNDRHSDVRCNANSSPGKRSPIELPSTSKVDNTSPGRLMKSTNQRKTPSPENRNENPIGRDFSSSRIAPSAALSVAKTPEAAPTTGKPLTVTPEVQNSLTIPEVLRKASTKSSAVPKNQTVANLLTRLAEKTPAVRKYPAIAPAMGHFSVMGKAAALMQPLTIPPTIGQYPTVTPTIGQYPTVTPTIGQYPTVTPTIGQYPTVTPTIGQETGRSSTVGEPPKVFIKIVPAAGKTESVNQVVSSAVVPEAPPAVGKNPVGHPAFNTITAAVQGTVPAVVPAFWGAPAVTTTLAVTPAVKKNLTVTAALSKAPAIGKDTITIPLDFLGLCPSFENTPAVRKNPAVVSMQTAPAVVSAGAPAVFPSIQTTPAVVSTGAPAVFPSIQTTPAIVSAGAPAVFPSIQTTPAVVSAGAPAVFPSIQTTPAIVSRGTAAVLPPGTRAVVSAGAPAVFPAEAPSVQTTPAIVSAGAQAVFPPRTCCDMTLSAE